MMEGELCSQELCIKSEPLENESHYPEAVNRNSLVKNNAQNRLIKIELDNEYDENFHVTRDNSGEINQQIDREQNIESLSTVKRDLDEDVLSKKNYRRYNFKAMSSTDHMHHQLNDKSTKSYDCDTCDYRTTNASNLKRHKYIHSGIKPYRCDECDYKCITSTDLKTHKFKHSGLKRFTCDICEYKCTSLKCLKVHKYKHLIPKSCERNFVSCKVPASNGVNRPKLKELHCNWCRYKCFSPSDLKSHKDTKHAPRKSRKTYKCGICVYRSMDARDLKRHTLEHSAVRYLECDSCDYRCTSLGDLKRHRCGSRSVDIKTIDEQPHIKQPHIGIKQPRSDVNQSYTASTYLTRYQCKLLV